MPVQDNQSGNEFSWTVSARPFKKRDREYFVTIIAIASVVGLILFIAEGLMPVVLLTSLVFLYYILNTVEPEQVNHKITEKGILFGETLNEWESMQKFWFSQKDGFNLLNIQTVKLPGRLEIVVKSEDITKITELLKKHLPEEEVAPTFLDKTTDWIGDKLPNK
jgi:hypothetical protein